MSVLSDISIKMRSVRPTAMTYFTNTDPDNPEKVTISDVSFYSPKGGETIEQLMATIQKGVDHFHQGRYGVNNLEEMLQNYPEENRAAVEAQNKDNFIKISLIKDEDDISDFWQPMIVPFLPESIKFLETSDGNILKVPSYGLGSCSYDIRIDRNFKVFKKPELPAGDDYTQWPEHLIIDTASNNPVEGKYEEFKDVDYVIIPPHGFALGNSVERISMPRNLITVCMPKSTLARMGIVAHITPLEPEWDGFITIEINNTTDYPVKVWANIGVMALMFLESDQPCEVSYKDRGGKYQDQPQLPIEPIN